MISEIIARRFLLNRNTNKNKALKIQRRGKNKAINEKNGNIVGLKKPATIEIIRSKPLRKKTTLIIF